MSTLPAFFGWFALAFVCLLFVLEEITARRWLKALGGVALMLLFGAVAVQTISLALLADAVASPIR